MNRFQNSRLSGPMICRLMRRNRVTIRGIADRFQITKKRIREVRTSGVTGFLAGEWHFMITGIWPDDLLHSQPLTNATDRSRA